MQVELLQNTSLQVCARAVRTCWQSQDKSDNGGKKDLELIDRVGNKFKHASTLEHLSYTFYIEGVSRALLQELARHRMASLSVKSTRYTLKELRGEDDFYDEDDGFLRASRYVVFTEDDFVNNMIVKNLENLRVLIKAGIANDKVKYCIPEAYKTELTWTINARSLQNFLHLRSSKSALWEIRDLSKMIFDNLPEEHKYLYISQIEEIKC